MGTLIFAGIALTYIVYSSRHRANAAVGAAILISYSQYLPSGGVPMLNIETLVMAVLLLAMIRRRAPGDPAPAKAPPLAVGLFVAFVVIGYIHSFFVQRPPEYDIYFVPSNNFMLFKHWMSVLFLFYASYSLCDTAEICRRVLRGAMIGFGIELAFCLLEFVVKASKVTGHMEVKNATGAFLATYGAVGLGLYLGSRGLPRRWIFLAFAVAGTIGTLGTRSRGGVLALAASLVIATLLRNRLLFVVVVILALTYQLWMPAPLLERFDSAYEVGADGSLHAADTAGDRIEIWKAGLRTVPDYPLGIGFGQYPYFVPKYGLEELLSRPMKNAHNIMVLVVVELSVLGGLVFLLMLTRLLLLSQRVSRIDPDPLLRAAGLGAFVGLLAAIAANMALNSLLRLDLAGVLWILLGLVARRAAGPTEPAPSES